MMPETTNSVLLSRLLVPILGLLVWGIYYLNGRLAFKPQTAKMIATRLSWTVGSVFIFMAQMNVMVRFAPSDAYGSYFAGFILIESGGALVVLFSTLLYGRVRRRQHLQTASALTPGNLSD
jgi:hypothetical protein